MIRYLLLFSVAALSGGTIGHARSQSDPPPGERDSDPSMIKDCGASCVAIVGSITGGAEVRFERAQELVDPDGDGLASMLDLVNGLSALGIVSSPMRTADLSVPGGVNILHVSSSDKSIGEDHFIVSEELAAGQFRFYCPPIGSKMGDAGALENMWSGNYVSVGDRGRSSWGPGAAVACLGLLVGGLAGVVRRSREGRELADA